MVELAIRAANVATLSNSAKLTQADFAEIQEVYFLLTAKVPSCTPCKVYSILAEITQLITPKPLPNPIMATNNPVRFKSGKEAARPIRHLSGTHRIITPGNLNLEDNGVWLLAKRPDLVEEITPEVAHVVESKHKKAKK